MANRVRMMLGVLLLSAASAWGQGMMGGYGMGPGMMGGYGWGPGPGGGYGMGPGMMGGYGMGPGMMGGYGGGRWAPGIPDLTDDQRKKLADIDSKFEEKQWQLMKSMHDLAFQADGTSARGKFDEQAARKHYDAMESLRRQMFENALAERKQIDGVLTAKQREYLQGGR